MNKDTVKNETEKLKMKNENENEAAADKIGTVMQMMCGAG